MGKLILMKYPGGKQALIPWVYGFFPAHKRYVEPFGGVANVLMNKKRSFYEVYNDLDRLLANMFKVMADRELREKLADRLVHTLHSEENYQKAFNLCLSAELTAESPPDIELAWAKVIAHEMAFNGHFGTPFSRSPRFRAPDWHDRLNRAAQRMRCVVIESTDWKAVVDRYDKPDCLFFLDPPYNEGSKGFQYYKSAGGDRLDEQIVERLKSLKGKFILCGFPCKLFDEQKWHRTERKRQARMMSDRTGREFREVIWANFPLTKVLEEQRRDQWFDKDSAKRAK